MQTYRLRHDWHGSRLRTHVGRGCHGTSMGFTHWMSRKILRHVAGRESIAGTHRVTIMDIARALGVSKSTVSRALAGDVQNVKPETMELICETARRMGYRRNEAAVNLRRQLSKTIGIVIPEVVTSFFMNFIQFAQHDLRQKGYRTIIAVSNEDITQERECLDMLVQCRVDGILMSVCHRAANASLYQDLMSRGIPMVFFDRRVDGVEASQVHIDDASASVYMMEKLIRSGCRKIVHLLGPEHIGNASDRLHGYREVLEKFKLPYNPQYVVSGGLSAEEGAQAMERFVRSGLEFDAVFGFTETAVLGAKSVLQRKCTAAFRKTCRFAAFRAQHAAPWFIPRFLPWNSPQPKWHTLPAVCCWS